MILAAGLGTRLLPFTEFCPKPLFPLLNRPLLLLIIERLQNAGFDHIVVNCHHLRRQIVDLIKNIQGVVVQEEEMILGTGGGLRLAMESFRNEAVLVTNGDIYHMVDFRSLYEAHQNNSASVTLAMHDFPRFNKISVHNDQVTGFDSPGGRGSLAFTGLHVLNPEILSVIPVMKPTSIIDLYRWLLDEKKCIRTLRVDGCYWTDMGTVNDYLALHGGLLAGDIPWWRELGVRSDSPFFLATGGHHADTVVMRDWVCAGRVEIGEDVHLERVVLWDGVSIPERSRLHDVLIIK
jgi:NDP-sugar pyrophosphorylase family protein